MKKTCLNLIEFQPQRRPGNALNIEIGAALSRCKLKIPENWINTNCTASRWLMSGGEALIFGICTPNSCPVNSVDL